MVVLPVGPRHPETSARGSGKLKFIIVAIDYFTKWMEAKPLSKTTCKEARLGQERLGWVDELPNILLTHHTMLKTSNVETPFSLTYGSEAVIPAELEMPIYRTIQFNETSNEEEMRLNLDLIQERRETAAIIEAQYKKNVENTTTNGSVSCPLKLGILYTEEIKLVGSRIKGS
uniref:Reverse transcriptase domain-containing protein n=1 Tax=Tanacetum cinerariifolium TaxID=118510 RepID=A0A6L2LBP3_TANCI|nr:reverse transcriptase domain-containing protein [Tanacetum cinerariifolium]